MKVIPVVDVLNGVAVHAVMGKRKEYKPLQSVLTNSVDPVEVAVAFKTRGFSTVYLADLDAILGKRPDLTLYSRIVDQTGLNLMVDAGVTDVQTAKTLQNSGVTKVIIGTETMKTKKCVTEAIQQLGADHVIVSLDVKNNRLLTQPTFEGSTDPLELLAEFRTLGVLEFILLDLARVGSGDGANTVFLKEALGILKEGIYVGGGVRNLADLLEIKELGVSGALVATALHTGKLDIANLIQAKLL